MAHRLASRSARGQFLTSLGDVWCELGDFEADLILGALEDALDEYHSAIKEAFALVEEEPGGDYAVHP